MPSAMVRYTVSHLMQRCAVFLSLGWSLVIVSCTTPSQVVVNITSDGESASRAQFLRLEVFAADGRDVPTYVHTEEFGSELPRLNVMAASLTVLPRNSDASRTFRVVATLVDGSRLDFSQRAAISSFLPGEVMEIWLHFDDVCAEVSCDERQTCTVTDGLPECVDACVTPSSPGSVVRSDLQSCGDSCDFAEEGGLCGDGTGRCWLGDCCHTCFNGERCLDETEQSLTATGVLGAECVSCECPGDGESPAGGCSSPELRGLALGAKHACITIDEQLYCWGDNDFGQLGIGEAGEHISEPAFIGAGLSDAALGGSHTCAQTDTSATCWGDNARFQLGDGEGESVFAPNEAVVPGERFESLSAGRVQTCGVRADGVYCWGSGSDGQTGVPGLNEDSPSVQVPTLVLPGNVTSMQTAHRTTCAIADGRLFCWGHNTSGGVGVSSDVERVYEPTESGLDKAGSWREVTVSQFGVCALDMRGHLYCRGEVRTDIVLSFDVEQPDEEHLIFQIGTERWRTIQLGAHFLCGIRLDDTLVCLGQNEQGQLGGDGRGRFQHQPIGMRWKRISAGVDFACAVRQDDTLWCWGNNALGQLGTTDPGDVHSDLPEPSPSSIFSREPRRICPPVDL